MIKDIFFFPISTDEDLSYVLEFSGIDLSGRSFQVLIKDRASGTTRATLTNGSGITITGTNVLEVAYAKDGMAGWPRGEYTADVVDITGGANGRIMAVRFLRDLPGRLVGGVKDRKAFVTWGNNTAVVTATGAIGPVGPRGERGEQGIQGVQGIQGLKGDTGNTGATGPANTLTIGTVTTLPYGQPAVVNITGAAPNQTLDIGLPRGEQGPSGSVVDGNKGDIIVSSAGSVWTANITDQPTAEAGSSNDGIMSPLRTKQSVIINGVGADYDSVSAASNLSVPSDRNNIRVAGFAAPGDGGAASYTRVIPNVEPSNPFKFSDVGGQWWEVVGPEFRPEMAGYFPNNPAIDVTGLQSVVSAAKPGCTIYLRDGVKWYASNPLIISDTPFTGPGADYLTYIYMPHASGSAWQDRSRFGGNAVARIHERSISSDSERRRFTAVSASGSASNVTWTPTNFILDEDGLGAFQSGAISGLWPRPGRYRITGLVVWSSDANGPRVVALTKNGTTTSEIISQNNTAATAGGVTTTQDFSFEVTINSQGDFVGLLLYQASGSTLTYTLNVTIEALYVTPVRSPGNRLGLCAGPWSDIITTHGGVQALAYHMANNYDTFIFCNILASNSGNGVWPDLPTKTWYNCVGPWGNGIAYLAGFRVHDAVADRMVICLVSHTSAASGTFAADWAANPTYWRVADQPLDFPYVSSAPWEEFSQTIGLVKQHRPDFEVFLYISASLDAPYVDSIGAPLAPYDGSRGFLNVLEFMNRYDRLYPEADGYFFDFAAPAYITAAARDAIVLMAKQRNKKVVFNLLSIGAAPLRFMAECPYIGAGDAALNEGFEYDAGVSVSAGTDAFLAELAKHRARGIRNFAFVEETVPEDVVPGSPKKAAALVKFNTNYVPGDGFGHSWASYTIV